MCNACGKLTEGSHFLRLYQARLGSLQILVGGLSGIASRSDFGLAAFPFSDIAVDKDEPTVRHRVAPDLNDPPIGPCALRPKLLIDLIETTAEFGLNIHGAELASFSKEAQVIGIAWTIR